MTRYLNIGDTRMKPPVLCDTWYAFVCSIIINPKAGALHHRGRKMGKGKVVSYRDRVKICPVCSLLAMLLRKGCVTWCCVRPPSPRSWPLHIWRICIPSSMNSMERRCRRSPGLIPSLSSVRSFPLRIINKHPVCLATLASPSSGRGTYH